MSQEQKPTREEVALAALNEHGFLLQSRIAAMLSDKPVGEWRLTAMEFPVSFASLDQETRVDLVLERNCHRENVHWYIPIECKRPNPKYKTWLFFNRRERIVTESSDHLYIEFHDLHGVWSGHGEASLLKLIRAIPVRREAGPEMFVFYVEAREKRPGQSETSSSTKAIEDAFHQISLGSVGLGQEYGRLGRINYRILPVIVTTAELCACDFEDDSVDLASGVLTQDKFKLRSLNWLCVNYAISQNLADAARLNAQRGRGLSEALGYRLLRSVFVVRTTKLAEFLKWVDKEIVK